jgi:hypothetical protein
LSSSKESIGVLGQLVNPGTAAPLTLELTNLGVAKGEQGDFGSHKEGGKGDKQEYKPNV